MKILRSWMNFKMKTNSYWKTNVNWKSKTSTFERCNGMIVTTATVIGIWICAKHENENNRIWHIEYHTVLCNWCELRNKASAVHLETPIYKSNVWFILHVAGIGECNISTLLTDYMQMWKHAFLRDSIYYQHTYNVNKCSVSETIFQINF